MNEGMHVSLFLCVGRYVYVLCGGVNKLSFFVWQLLGSTLRSDL